MNIAAIKKMLLISVAYLGCIILVILLTYCIVEKDITVLFIIFAIVAIIILTSIVYYTTTTEKQKKTSRPESDSINILNLRYIRGEITKEKYEQLKKGFEEDKKTWIKR